MAAGFCLHFCSLYLRTGYVSNCRVPGFHFGIIFFYKKEVECHKTRFFHGPQEIVVGTLANGRVLDYIPTRIGKQNNSQNLKERGPWGLRGMPTFTGRVFAKMQLCAVHIG